MMSTSVVNVEVGIVAWSLNADGTPVVGSLDGRRCCPSGGFGSTAEHDTAGENGSLSPIIRRDIRLRRIDKDLGLSGPLAT